MKSGFGCTRALKGSRMSGLCRALGLRFGFKVKFRVWAGCRFRDAWAEDFYPQARNPNPPQETLQRSGSDALGLPARRHKAWVLPRAQGLEKFVYSSDSSEQCRLLISKPHFLCNIGIPIVSFFVILYKPNTYTTALFKHSVAIFTTARQGGARFVNRKRLGFRL